MVKHTVTTTVIVNEATQLTFTQVCEHVGVSETVLRELLEQGLLQEFDATLQHEQVLFDASQLTRVQTAARLRQDLGVNAPGAVLALELFDEIQALQHALDILSRQLR